ncbi:hypothetical protein F5Y13DRAFT_195524 [Hypoxylon sp. FL1857]|nr:hypothetical protein F5Y13DRAFT_195524 [Hypoxylon sp. FL1857]
MASEKTTDAVYNGKTTLSINHNQSLGAARLEAFMTAPPSTILASDLEPQNIQIAHEIRIASELKTIAHSLPRV